MFGRDLGGLICEYCAEYVPSDLLLRVADFDDQWMQYLNLNERAFDWLLRNPNKIAFGWLAANPSAIGLLRENLDKIDWWFLSRNPAAVDLLETNLTHVHWDQSRSYASIAVESRQDRLVVVVRKPGGHGLVASKPGKNLLVSFITKPQCDGLVVSKPNGPNCVGIPRPWTCCVQTRAKSIGIT